MTKPKSIERRIRHTVLAAVALTLAVTVTSVLVANERLELAILELDMQAERDFLLGLTDPDQPLLWETADMQGIYVPQALVGSTELPAIFHNHPFPFAEEVEIGPDTFMVTAVSTENGRLYLAKNITLFEQQEGVFERFLVVMCFVMLGVATLLARMTGRRLAAPLAENVPLATLAAILFVVAWNMSEARHLWRLFHRAPAVDVFILLATFLLTILTDLVIAVNIGVVLAMLHFMRSMAESVKVNAQTEAQLRQEFAYASLPAFPAGLHVYAAEGPFFFGAAEAFVQALSSTQAHTHAEIRTVLIRMRHVPFVDATGLQALEDVIVSMQRRGIAVLVTEADAGVVRKMRRMGLVERLGAENLLASVPQAIRSAADRAACADPAAMSR